MRGRQGFVVRPETVIGDIGLTETVYHPGAYMPRHPHDRAYLSVVLAGGYDERIGSRDRFVQAADILLHPEEEEHEVRFGAAGARIINVILGPRLTSKLCDAGIRPCSEAWRPGPESRWLTRRLRGELEQNDAASKLAIEGIVMELLASGLRANGRPANRRLEEARDYLSARLSEPVTLAEVAAAAGLHPAYLCRAFRERFGQTVGEFLREKRLERAMRLMDMPDMSLGAIAAECGFSDQAHLSRLFRARTGMTPTAYRKRG